MPYIGTSPTQGVRVRYIYTATSSQTAFSGADANGVTLRYQDEEYVDVYKNGLILKTGTDYSLSNNTTMTLASGASNGDKIAIIVYDVFNVTVDDAYTKSTADSRFLNVAGDTMSGALDLNGVELVLDADADTSITADTDDQIDIKIAGADDFQFTANTFTAQSGSSIVVPDGGLTFGSTAITSTGAELNILDGVTATTAELNILDGVTATAAELNALDGITATVTELNLTDGGSTIGTTAVADGHGILMNHGGTMAQTTVQTLAAYLDDEITAMPNLTTASSGSTIKLAGKETIYVPASAMYPESTNGCSALAQVELSNGPELKCLDFDASSDEHAQFTVAFPKSWNEGTVTFKAYFTVTGTNTGTTSWALSGVAMSDDDTINASFGTAVAPTAKAHSGTSNDLNVTAESGAVTIAGSPAAEDMVFFRIMRDVSADDQSGDSRLLGIKLFFTTDAANDA
tara:strand:+ start:43 stop:1422 length:1380 start_codon:yes stop_codon:yes gene_type:complete